MHTVPSPFSPNYHYYPPRYSNQGEVPMHENELVETTRVVTHRTAAFHTKQEYDCPDSLDLAGDDLVNTLLVGTDFSKTLLRSPVQDSLLNLPSQIVELILSLENLSASLSISEKQSLSHQLTKLSYSLQTQCLYPDISQDWEKPTKRTPSPPTLTPRKPITQIPSVPIMAPRISTPSAPSDWSGPGSFPNYHDQNRPTKLGINTLPSPQRSASVQYDQKCLVKQKSEDVIYANTSPTSASGGPHTHKLNLAPPLPPRDHAVSTPDYENLPPSRGSKKKVNY